MLGASVLLAALVVVVVLATGGSPHVSKVPATVSRTGPESIFEDEGLLRANPAATLETLQRLGVDRVRVYIAWNAVAPDPNSKKPPPEFNAADPGAYPAAGWTVYDAIVRDAAALKIGLDLTVGAPPPLWARGPGDPGIGTAKNPLHSQWRPSSRDFGLFMRALGTRYSGRYRPPGAGRPVPAARFWSIWNEPNFGPDLAPQTIDHSTLEVSPMLYRGLLGAAWDALHATGHGHDTILFGETAPAGVSVNGPGRFSNMVPLRFLRALYCVDSDYRALSGVAAKRRGCPTDASASAGFAAANPALFHASGFANHPYSQGLAPNQPTPAEPDYAELADIPKLERALDAVQRAYGARTRFSIYSTEFGYQTKPPDPEPGTVSPNLAAYYLNWSEYLTWRDPRQVSYDQYLLRDPANGIFAAGIETPSGAPKPGYYAYRMPIYLPVTATAAGHPLAVWGCVRPVSFARRQTHRPQLVKIEFQAGGHGAFHTVRTVPLTNRHGYFYVFQTFPGSGTVRLSWSYPRGPRIFSRTVAITLN